VKDLPLALPPSRPSTPEDSRGGGAFRKSNFTWTPLPFTTSSLPLWTLTNQMIAPLLGSHLLRRIPTLQARLGSLHLQRRTGRAQGAHAANSRGAERPSSKGRRCWRRLDWMEAWVQHNWRRLGAYSEDFAKSVMDGYLNGKITLWVLPDSKLTLLRRLQPSSVPASTSSLSS
jgi:hypothetical protein